MEAIAFIYDLKEKKGKTKTYLIRKIFGYTDTSNHGKYKYQREGTLTPHIIEKWGKSVIITKKTQKTKVQNILKKNNIPFQTRKLKLIN